MSCICDSWISSSSNSLKNWDTVCIKLSLDLNVGYLTRISFQHLHIIISWHQQKTSKIEIGCDIWKITKIIIAERKWIFHRRWGALFECTNECSMSVVHDMLSNGWHACLMSAMHLSAICNHVCFITEITYTNRQLILRKYKMFQNRHKDQPLEIAAINWGGRVPESLWQHDFWNCLVFRSYFSIRRWSGA